MSKISRYNVFEMRNKYYLYDWKRIETYEISSEMYDFFRDKKDLTQDEFLVALGMSQIAYKEDIVNLVNDEKLFYDRDNCDAGLFDISSINIMCGVGYKCNLDCEYCMLKEKDEELDDIDETKLIVNIISVLEEVYSVYDEIKITITDGGEPFLFRNQIIKLINEINRVDIHKRVKLIVVTNGTIYDEQLLKVLDDNKVSIVFSLDGHLENNIVRKSKNGEDNFLISTENYKKFHEILESQISNNIWGISVVNVKTKSLVTTLMDLYELGFRTIQMRIVKGMKESIGINETNLNHFLELYSELFDFLICNVKKGDEKYIKAILNNGDFVGQLMVPLLLGRAKFKRCLGAYSTISIDYKGRIYPCTFLNGNPNSEIRSLEYSDVVAHKYRDINVYTVAKCSVCWASTVCGGHCPYQAMKCGNAYDEPDLVMCKLTKYVVENIISLIDIMEEYNFEMYERIYEFAKKRTYIYDILE